MAKAKRTRPRRRAPKAKATNSIPPPPSFDSFTCFPKLPIELRLEICKHAMPGPRNVHVCYRKSKSARLSSTSQVPVVLHVCKEWREEALKTYQLGFGGRNPANIFFNFGIDTLHFEINPETHLAEPVEIEMTNEITFLLENVNDHSFHDFRRWSFSPALSKTPVGVWLLRSGGLERVFWEMNISCFAWFCWNTEWQSEDQTEAWLKDCWEEGLDKMMVGFKYFKEMGDEDDEDYKNFKGWAGEAVEWHRPTYSIKWID